jgi:hypothetical protein
MLTHNVFILTYIIFIDKTKSIMQIIDMNNYKNEFKFIDFLFNFQKIKIIYFKFNYFD